MTEGTLPELKPFTYILGAGMGPGMGSNHVTWAGQLFWGVLCARVAGPGLALFPKMGPTYMTEGQVLVLWCWGLSSCPGLHKKVPIPTWDSLGVSK